MPSAVIKCPFSNSFPDVEATAKIRIIQEIDTEDQGPSEMLIYEGNAIYSQETKTVFNSESKQIALSGDLIIKGDVQHIGALSDVQGYVEIEGIGKKQIYQMSKPVLMGFVYSTEVTLR
ncbi:MAG: hypothetical protein HFF01_00870 [Erysipelotrichaceae bacterium]|jgi:hypothetical protein|nr:hypothetical protein [Erysipelotrichaceae bacterium]